VSESGEPAPARPVKRPSAFRTIGEVADDLDLPAHVLRFWESKFPQLKPLKRGGGRRYYRPEDIVLLRRIRQCLYNDGYTIRGVQKLLADLSGAGAGAAAASPVPAAPSAIPSLFPLDAAPASPLEPLKPLDRADELPPVRRPRRRPAPAAADKPDNRAALEEIRRELGEARAMLDDLLRRPTRRP
jgi:DNA-binding transcriptional MerR regulator